MKTVIHVNQHNIKHNAKIKSVKGRDSRMIYDPKPVLTVKDYKQNRKADEAIIYDKDGEVAAKVIYSPDKPLPCGARVWIETQNKVEVS